MHVDMQIALYPQRDVDQRVFGQLLEHVVEKPDAGLDVIGAGTIEIEATSISVSAVLRLISAVRIACMLLYAGVPHSATGGCLLSVAHRLRQLQWRCAACFVNNAAGRARGFSLMPEPLT